MTPNDIKNIRKATGLSQSKFADRHGFNLRTLQDWEVGRRTPNTYAQVLLRGVANWKGFKNE